MRTSRLAVMVAVVGLLMLSNRLPAQDKPADKSIDQQFEALGASRSKADVAIRKARDFFEKNENTYRVIGMAVENAHTRISDEFRKALETEMRKPDDARDNDRINSITERSKQVERDWIKFVTIDRQAIETHYRGTAALVQTLQQIFGQLAGMESYWKDAKLDLGSLQNTFDALAARAQAVTDDGQKTTDQLTQIQKTWEGLTTLGK